RPRSCPSGRAVPPGARPPSPRGPVPAGCAARHCAARGYGPSCSPRCRQRTDTATLLSGRNHPLSRGGPVPADLPIPADDPARSLTVARPDSDQRLPHIGLVGDTYTILIAGGDTD